ncbi:hypothetical protein A1O7_01817 [Cladophialophora yegresii CBS 114405]|uniref:Major facilitator superfamily (MFS) profile domain-containing protein n=1 Tax=Cladophialophora yegresii CBS 114405 TaxID=1182544 RepID=W9WLI8_9EURO|nr:uncharacterized protein A1O7_01817 [Cladophialophora yegresii CBS 114405]EXJ65476.1 hypothetical protein A1O7_01817 [Cladophialophora yegresii CBS 114405]
MSVPIIAAIGGQLAAEFGDPVSSNWYVASWTTGISVSFMMWGANTDVLGRRWFLIAGQVICVAAHLIIARSTNAEMMIAGMAVNGFGAALCQMAAFALPELLPNKWRHIGIVLADLMVYIIIIVFPVTARYGVSGGDWRAHFYTGAILQAASFLGLYFFYFPPAHPLGLPFSEALRQIDFIGIILFICAAVPILIGLVWTGIYESDSLHVVISLPVGFALLVVFGLWETFGWAKRPLTPPAIFSKRRGRDFAAPCVAVAVINMFYYSSSLIWPTLIDSCYTTAGQPWKKAAGLAVTQGVAITLGAMGLSFLGGTLKHYHWQLTLSTGVMVLFGALHALATPDNLGLMLAFMFLCMVGYGWAIYLCIAFTQMGVVQEQLGISGGLSGSIRFAGGTLAQAVYQSVNQNEIAKKTPLLLTRAAERVGVPAARIPLVLELATQKDKLLVAFSPAVVTAVEQAQQEAVVAGIKMIAYTSLAFGVVGIAACMYCSDVDAKMNDKIEIFLENDIYAERNVHH